MGRMVGYSYWGYLGDFKVGPDMKPASTPDGNAFYSTSIIAELQSRNVEVIQVMPDRDRFAYGVVGDCLFSSWGSKIRSGAYKEMTTNPISIPYADKLFGLGLTIFWNSVCLNKADYIIHEWRFEIPGRNDDDTRVNHPSSYQPDLWVQNLLIDYCINNKIKMFIFDLDYKLTVNDVDYLLRRGLDFCILDLGLKWTKLLNRDLCLHVDLPFNANIMFDEDPAKMQKKLNFCYIGNRYERDQSFEKYFGENSRYDIFGKWIDGEKDYPHCKFHGRIQSNELKKVYNSSVATLLVAKPEYYEHGFMTARILEALCFGCLPLFAEEYGANLIESYCGDKTIASLLTVHSADDLSYSVDIFSYNAESEAYAASIVRMLRLNAYNNKFHHASDFIDLIETRL